MPNTSIVLAPALPPPASSTLLELTLRATGGTPNDILLYQRPIPEPKGRVTIVLEDFGITDLWPNPAQIPKGVVWYQNGIRMEGQLSAGSAIYPTPPDVRASVQYGPSGADYTGTYAPGPSLPDKLFVIDQSVFVKLLSDKFALTL